MLRQITQPKCKPISLDQARKHLAVDASDRSNDTLIELLIEAATADSQMKTGRVWVECDWEWKPETVATGVSLDFPLVPVVGVKLYDLSRPIIEDTEPDDPTEAPELPPEGDNGDGDTGSGDTDNNAPEAKRGPARGKRRREAGIEPPAPAPVEPEYEEVSAEYVKIEYPSLEPIGYPAIGSMTPLQAFPDKYRLVLTVGYPTTVHTEDVEQFDNPELIAANTGYTDNLIWLVFNRPVKGEISIANFEVRKKAPAPVEPEPDPEEPPAVDPDPGESAYADADSGDTEEPPVEPPQEDEIIQLEDAYFQDGAVVLQYPQGALSEGDTIHLSFFEGAIYDDFENFVQPIIFAELPPVAFGDEADFPLPEPVPETEVYESLAPAPIKNWILTRVGSLYSQRTEIALRAGKSNDAMFPDQFINNLLDPYRVRFMGGSYGG